MNSRFKQRPLSWSQISSFEWSPDEWYERYILNKRTPPTKEMLFGSMVGKKLEKDSNYFAEIPRSDIMEYEYNVVFNKIHMIGFSDTQSKDNKYIGEYKTGKKAWDQKRVDNHGQLTMYALMNFIKNKVNPKDVEIELHWMPTEERGDFTIDFVQPPDFKTFKTKRTMADILEFGLYINETVKLMDAYLENNPLR